LSIARREPIFEPYELLQQVAGRYLSKTYARWSTLWWSAPEAAGGCS